jgi:hypothetical protein
MWKWAPVIVFGILPVAVRAQSTIASLTVTPTTVTFTAANPAASPAPISTTVNWRITGGAVSRPWTLRVQALPASVSNCPLVPVSAFRVTCNSLNMPPTATGSCVSGPIVLSGTPQVVANGNQGSGNRNYRANLQVSFADSWRYPGALSPACSVNLIYTLEAP